MPFPVTIFAAEEAERQQFEAALAASGQAALAGRPRPLPQPFTPADPQWHTLLQQAPEAVLIGLPPANPEPGYELIAWLRAQLPQTHIMVVGPLELPRLIVGAMRAGANEYLESPLRPSQLAETLARCAAARSAHAASTLRPVSRGKLIAVLGARGGCGSTTVAVNLALALHAQRRQADAAVALLDAAPLGHAALHLNLKPQFTLTDLLGHAQRLDAAMLTSLMVRHDCGLELLAGPSAPLPAGEPSQYTTWIELLLQNFPLVVTDLSARLDPLTQAIIELADRILFVTQTDMVSLWSAAKVRQHLDAPARLRFELVLNRYTATPEVDLAGVEAITHASVLWKLPNAHALVMDAIEHGKPPALDTKSELARSYRGLAAALLGRTPQKRRGWLPFLRLRAAT